VLIINYFLLGQWHNQILNLFLDLFLGLQSYEIKNGQSPTLVFGIVITANNVYNKNPAYNTLKYKYDY